MLTQTFSRALIDSQLSTGPIINLRQLLIADVNKCLLLQDNLGEVEKNLYPLEEKMNLWN